MFVSLNRLTRLALAWAVWLVGVNTVQGEKLKKNSFYAHLARHLSVSNRAVYQEHLARVSMLQRHGRNIGVSMLQRHGRNIVDCGDRRDCWLHKDKRDYSLCGT